jgi:hypothetical protein
MPQSNDPEILAYLSQPENLPLTLEVAAYAEQARSKLLTDFRSEVKKAVEDARPAGRKAPDFACQEIGTPEDEYAGMRWIAKAAATQRENLAVTIEHYAAKDRHAIYYGLRWNSGIRPADPIYSKPEVSALRDRLVGAAGFETSSVWWLCWRDIHEFTSTDDFLCAYVNDRAAILTPLASAFWELVADTDGELAKVNRLVAKR